MTLDLLSEGAEIATTSKSPEEHLTTNETLSAGPYAGECATDCILVKSLKKP